MCYMCNTIFTSVFDNNQLLSQNKGFMYSLAQNYLEMCEQVANLLIHVCKI